MKRSWMAVPLLAVATAAGCEDEEDQGVRGTFDLFVTIAMDTCGDDASRVFSTRMTVEGEGDDIVVQFGEDAVLDGFIDEQGFVQAMGPATVAVPVGADTVDVVSTLQLQFGVRPSRSEASGRLTFDGTHPAAPGVSCFWEFVASAQRLSRSPIF